MLSPTTHANGCAKSNVQLIQSRLHRSASVVLSRCYRDAGMMIASGECAPVAASSRLHRATPKISVRKSPFANPPPRLLALWALPQCAGQQAATHSRNLLLPSLLTLRPELPPRDAQHHGRDSPYPQNPRCSSLLTIGKHLDSEYFRRCIFKTQVFHADSWIQSFSYILLILQSLSIHLL